MPQPNVQGEFNGLTLTAQNATVNTYIHNYMLQLPTLTQKVCGNKLTITATGHNGTLTFKTEIFLKDCKYDYYIHLILLNNF